MYSTNDRTIAGILAILLMAGGTFVPARSQSDANASSDSLVAAIGSDRAASMEWLRTSPTSYLAAIARVDFEGKSRLTIGRDPSNDVVVPEQAFAPHHLSATVVGDSFLVSTLDPAATFTSKGETVAGARVLGPSYISVDRFFIRLSHQRFPAIIVFDPKSPRFEDYKGLAYFPVDLRYRYVLPMERNPVKDTIVILSTRGNKRTAVREGWFRVLIDSVPCVLEVSRLLEPGIGDEVYSIFFRDATSDVETYPVGRYLDVERLPDGRFVMDFNRAYNPACAISPFYNCPLPPEQNILRVRIPAGEKDSHYSSH